MDKNNIPKILAVYLPQFHETPDNNLWWGEGFTDWQSVKTAEPLFTMHNQPRVPLESQYYDLSQKETMMNQAQLAKKYGIDGFCFYHYYFENGKRELEKPAENLLKWKDIDMPFCFNWASESWIRSWSKICGNVWAEKYEKEDNLGSVLAKQNYGTEREWVNHFNYLLPFFQDSRYIRIDNRPVFIFYSPDDIAVLHEMIACWRELAEKAGLKGLYLIGAHMNAADRSLDAAIVYEPRNAINKLNLQGKVKLNNNVRCFEYESLWDEILEDRPILGFKTFYCGVTGYDDTPRRGNSGEVLINESSVIFKKKMLALIKKSIREGNEVVFINAWNEWGEGMYLEPDESNGYAYLEAIREIKEKEQFEDVERKEKCNSLEINQEMERLDYGYKKFKKLFEIMDKWLYLEQQDNSKFKEFLDERQISSVAVYGISSLGKHLIIQLKKEGIGEIYGIDQYVGQYGCDFKIYRPENELPRVDMIVITAYEVEKIRNKLRKRFNECTIFSIEEIIDLIIE